MIKLNVFIHIVVCVVSPIFIYWIWVPKTAIAFLTKLSRLWGEQKYKKDNNANSKERQA